MNVLQATMLAMKRAYDALGMEGEVLIDGNKVPYGLVGRAVVKGDSKYACIAAASILAKTERDRLMTELAAQYPAYGFERHFGYSTPEHLAALAEHGPSKIHRMSFAPCQPDEQLCLIFSD